MSTCTEITARIQLPVPPDRAWLAVVDWPGQDRWMLATQVHGDHGLHARVVARTGYSR